MRHMAKQEGLLQLRAHLQLLGAGSEEWLLEWQGATHWRQYKPSSLTPPWLKPPSSQALRRFGIDSTIRPQTGKRSALGRAEEEGTRRARAGEPSVPARAGPARRGRTAS